MVNISTNMKMGLSGHTSFSLTPFDFMRIARKSKVQFVEVKLDDLKLQEALQRRRMQRIRKLTHDLDLRLTAHLPYIDVNLASLNTEVASASLESLEGWVHRAAEMNVEILVCHAGRLSRDYPAAYLRWARRNVIHSLRHLSRTARGLGLRFTVENDHDSPDQVIAGRAREVKKIAQEANCEVTFDVGHANTTGELPSFVHVLDGLIANVHLHDNDGKSDQHLAIGEASIDFALILRELKDNDYDGPLIIEAHSLNDLSRSVNRLSKILATV